MEHLDRGEGDVAIVVFPGQAVEYTVVVVEVVVAERFANGLDRDFEVVGPKVRHSWDLGDFDFLLREPLDVAEQSFLLRFDKGDCHPFSTGSTDTADAVDIAL